MPPNEKKTETSTQTIKAATTSHPPAWQMDPAASSMMANCDLTPEQRIKISMILLEYETKCSIARIEMIEALKKLISPAEEPLR